MITNRFCRLFVLIGASMTSCFAATVEQVAGRESPQYSSRLEFIVERYSLDDCAKQEYQKLHPSLHTLADLNAKLLNFRASAEKYRDWLKAADEIIRAVFADVPPSKAARIDDAFSPLLQAIEGNLDVVAKLIAQHGADFPAPPVSPEVVAYYHRMENKVVSLKFGNPEDLSAAIVAQIATLKKAGGPALQTMLQRVSTRVNALQADQKVVSACKELSKAIKQAGSNGRSGEQRIKSAIAEGKSLGGKTQESAANVEETGGDLLQRRYFVYQDLSDPFLDYIARHPEQWKEMSNRGLVAGDGDTQFIIVFENQLDGRFNFVSVDPTKVIQARMRIGRQVAQSLVSVAGVATKAFGVPLPASLITGQSQTNSGTMDFSTMTASQTQMKLQNAVDRKSLDALRKFAIDALANFPNDAAKADDLRKDLIRRLQPYVPH